MKTRRALRLAHYTADNRFVTSGEREEFFLIRHTLMKNMKRNAFTSCSAGVCAPKIVRAALTTTYIQLEKPQMTAGYRPTYILSATVLYSKFPFPSKTRKEMWADSHSLYIINGKKKNIGVPVKTGGRRPMGLIAQPAMIDDGPCFSSSLSFVSPIAALDIVS